MVDMCFLLKAPTWHSVTARGKSVTSGLGCDTLDKLRLEHV